MMSVTEFFTQSSDKFVPLTPLAAIKAFEVGILPIEHFIYQCTSAVSLDEELIELDEIERLLAKPNLDLHAHLILMKILEKLSNNSDPEIALFAAESISLIEFRYNKKIEKLKDDLKKAEDPEKRIQLAHLYYEQAFLNYKKESIRIFYLKEAYQYLRVIIQLETLNLKDIQVLIRILMELKQFDNALALLVHLNKDDNIYLMYLTAQIEFERRNFIKVYTIIDRLKARQAEWDVNMSNIFTYWMDSPWIERSEFV